MGCLNAVDPSPFTCLNMFTGESRDRGQAMVDLMAQYRQAGLELNVNEL